MARHVEEKGEGDVGRSEETMRSMRVVVRTRCRARARGSACLSCSMKTSMGVKQGSYVNAPVVHACVTVHVASRQRSHDDDLHNEQRTAQCL